MPADGNRAANLGTGDFGRSPIFVQLSDKPRLASDGLLGVPQRQAQWADRKIDRMRKHSCRMFRLIVLDFGQKGAHARIGLRRLSERGPQALN